MRRIFTAALAAIFLATSAEAQPTPGAGGVSDLTYSAPTDKTVYLTGQAQGKAVHVVHTGLMGAGQSTIYAGEGKARVRMIVDDAKGLLSIVALETGLRIAVNPVRQERVEYRLYAPNRSFVIGAVLYKKDGRWLQGLMKTEGFMGYETLIDITDVTDKMAFDATMPAPTRFAGVFPSASDLLAHLSPISRAHAQDTAQDEQAAFERHLGYEGRDIVRNDIVIGSMAGAGAFLVQLIRVSLPELSPAVTPQLIATVATVTPIVAPYIASVALGVVIGSHLYNANERLKARLADAASTDARNAEFAAMAGLQPPKVPVLPRPAGYSLLDKADFQDNQDARDAAEKANFCTEKFDFACAETEIAKAAKYARGTYEKGMVSDSQDKLERGKVMLENARRQAAAEAAAKQAAANSGGGGGSGNGLVGRWVGGTTQWIFNDDGTGSLTNFAEDGSAANTTEITWSVSGNTLSYTIGRTSSTLSSQTASGGGSYSFPYNIRSGRIFEYQGQAWDRR